MSVLFGLGLGTFTAGCGDVPNDLDAVEVAESELAPRLTATKQGSGVTRSTSFDCIAINGFCSDDFVVPADVTTINVIAIGGGGGGGGASGLFGSHNGRDWGSGGGAGGGFGQYVNVTNVAVTPGSVLKIQIGGQGRAGVGGWNSNTGYSATDIATTSGSNGSSSFVKTVTATIALALGGCGGTRSLPNPGSSSCGGGPGGNGGMDAGGGGGGGGAAGNASGGAGASVVSQWNGGSGGVAGVTGLTFACGGVMSKGGVGGHGGNNATDGSNGSDGVCGGGGGGGGGNGSTAYNQCNGGAHCGEAGGAGGSGGAGRVVLRYDTALQIQDTAIHIQKYSDPGGYAFSLPSGFSRLKIAVWGAGGRGDSGGYTNCCSSSTGLGGVGGSAGSYQVNTFNGGLYPNLSVQVGAGGNGAGTGGSSFVQFNSTVLITGAGGGGGSGSGTSIGGLVGNAGPETGAAGVGGLDPGCGPANWLGIHSGSDGLPGSAGATPGGGGGGGSGGRHCGYGLRKYGGGGGNGGNGQVTVYYW